MTKIEWASPGSALYESGIDRGVLYVNNGIGVPWNGIISVEEKASGGQARPFYVDGFKYLNLPARTEYEATLTAFYSPREFDVCDGVGVLVEGLRAMNQRRMPFGLTYRTLISASDGTQAGYKIHLVYNALAAPSARNHVTLSDNVEPETLSWDLTTRPVRVSGIAPTAYFTLNSLETDPLTMAVIEDIIYGTDDQEPRLPDIAEIIQVYTAEWDGLLVIDHIDLGDGSFTVSGRDEVVEYTGPNTFRVTSRYAEYINSTSYRLTSSE